MTSNTRIIKKYPNRRLYDTEESRYITLADVKELVVKKVDFTVIDKKSGDDITRSILLQVIAEQEQRGEPIMSEGFLSQIIRSYGDSMPNFVANYLEQSLQLFMKQQKTIRGQVKKVVGVDPVLAVADITQKNYNRWKSLQDEVLNAFLGSHKDEDSADSKTSTKTPSEKS